MRAFLLAGLLVCGAAGAQKPNIVFILADDLGWADLACYGNDYNETPNLDRLARQGMRFTNAYAAGPVCSPTRASILTGKTPARTGITEWIPGDYRPHMPLECPVTAQFLPLEEFTLGEALKEGGYATAYVGKWHLGETKEYYPRAQGFDYAVAEGHRPAGYFSPYELPGIEIAPDGEYLTDRLGVESAKLISKLARNDSPYFLFVSHYAVHSPIVAKEEKIAKYRAKGRDLRGAEYAAMLESLDAAVGAVLDAVEASGEADNTIVIFMSDNGGFYQATENWPLRGYKSNLYEGGIRVPLIVRWPGHVKARSRCDAPVVSHDFYPTLLEAAGLPLRPAQHVDGVSFMPALRGDKSFDRGPITWHYPHYITLARGEPSSAIRDGRYKYLYFYDGDRQELYNLDRDPGEQKNLARLLLDKAAELKAQLDRALADQGAKFPTRNPRPQR
jgi:arylsulfatase A-like enzyme